MIRWIASYPKSGNTWIRLFLMAYADPAAFNLNARSGDHTSDTNPDIYEEVAKVELQCVSDAEARLLRGAVLVRLARIAQANTGGPAYLKTHSANVVVNGMSWIPPDFTDRAVYVLRDPRDVVVSLADHLGLDLDGAIATMADTQRKLDRGFGGVHVPIMSWSMHIGSWRRKLPYGTFAVRYEDLLDDPGRWFQVLLNFFELPFDRARFNEALEWTTFEALRVAEDRHGYAAKSDHQARFFRRGEAGGWRDTLSAEQVAQVEADHGDAMRECGYVT